MPNAQKEYKQTLDAVLVLHPNHTDARNRLVLLAKAASPSEALQLLPEPSPDEDPETKLYRAVVLTSLKRYKDALAVLASLNAASFENHFEARLCRARAFRGNGEYEPAYIHATKAVEIQGNEASLMTRASIVLEFWEWQRRRGLIVFGDTTGIKRGSVHARLIASVPSTDGLLLLTDSQQVRLGVSVNSTTVSSASASSSATSSSENPSLHPSSAKTTAALTRSLLMSTRPNVSSKLPPMNQLLSIALNDLNRVLDLRPNSILARLKRGTLLHIMGAFRPSIADLTTALSSPVLQPSERPALILKLVRVLFDAGEQEDLLKAHEILSHQLHIALDIDLMAADVATLLVIGTISQLLRTDLIVQAALRAMSDHSPHAMAARHMGPLLLLRAKINKRISEMKQLKEEDLTATESTTVNVASSSISASTIADVVEEGEVELQLAIQYANDAASHIDDVRVLVRESAFWRQSGESELALIFANQALSVDPNNVPAKLSRAAELLAKGDDADVLTTLFGLSDEDPQVVLYRLLAGRKSTLDQLENLESYISQLVSPDYAFAKASLEIRMRCWTTAQFHRGRLLWQLQQRASARETFEEVLHALPTHPGALMHLAELYMVEGELATSIVFFQRRLLQSYSRKLRVHLLLRIASCHHMLGAYASCLEALDTLLLLDPKHKEALALKTDASRLNTHIGSAMAYTREAVQGVTSYLKKFLWSGKATSATNNSGGTIKQAEDHELLR